MQPFIFLEPDLGQAANISDRLSFFNLKLMYAIC